MPPAAVSGPVPPGAPAGKVAMGAAPATTSSPPSAGVRLPVGLAIWGAPRQRMHRVDRDGDFRAAMTGRNSITTCTLPPPKVVAGERLLGDHSDQAGASLCHCAWPISSSSNSQDLWMRIF